jgi:hypothetical protein
VCYLYQTMHSRHISRVKISINRPELDLTQRAYLVLRTDGKTLCGVRFGRGKAAELVCDHKVKETMLI